MSSRRARHGGLWGGRIVFVGEGVLSGVGIFGAVHSGSGGARDVFQSAFHPLVLREREIERNSQDGGA